MVSRHVTTKTKWSCAVAIAVIGAGVVLAWTGHRDAGKLVAGIGIGFAGGIITRSGYFLGQKQDKE